MPKYYQHKDRRISSNSRKLLLARQNYFWYSGFWFWQKIVVFLMFGIENTTVTSRHSVFPMPSAVSSIAESEVLGECSWLYENYCNYYSLCCQYHCTHKQPCDPPANPALARWKSWDCTLLCLGKHPFQFHDINISLPTTSWKPALYR